MSGDFYLGSMFDYLASLMEFIGNVLYNNDVQIFGSVQDVLDKVGDLRGSIIDDIHKVLDEVLGKQDGLLGDILNTIENKVIDGIGRVVNNAGGAVIDVRDVAKATIGNIGAVSVGGLNLLNNTLNAGVTQSFSVIDQVEGAVGDSLNGIIDKIVQVLKDAINTMTQGIRNALQGAIDAVTQVVNNIVSSIKGVVTDAINGIQNLLSSVVSGIQNLIKGAVDSITSVADKVFTAVSDVVTSIRDKIVETFNNVVDFISKEIDKAGDFIGAAVDNIKAVGQQLLESAQGIYNEITTGIHNAIDGLVGATESVVSGIREGITDLQAALQQAFEQVGPILKDAVVTPLTDAAKKSFSFFTEGVNDEFSQLIIPPEQDIRNMLASMGVPKEAVDRIIDISGKLWNGSSLVKNLFLIFMGIQICLAFAQQVSAAAGVRLLQEVQPGFAVALPDIGSLSELQRQGVMDDAAVITTLEKSGYGEPDAKRMLNLAKRFPEIGIVQVWMLRGFINRETASDMLGRLGFVPEDRPRLLDMAYFIPPPSDLIVMAVREAFTPDIAEKFGQFQNFPADFAKYGAMQGISEEWAKRYWAAHWSLPSVQMGFEMLHRRVIDDETLQTLLRAHDVMPFWRDKLTAISYNPLTRVDIRRMHQLGVLSDSEVHDAYLDIGYNEANAQRLTQFTIELNKHHKTAAPENLETLTRAAVVDLYSKGALQRQQAEDLLAQIGVGKDAASIYLDISDLNEATKDRAKQTATIIEQAKVGSVSFTEAQDRLHSLGLEPVEIERALADLAQAQAQTTKIPTKDDLDKLLQAGLIEGAVYIATMILNGYNPIWAERFYELAKKGIKK